MNIEIYKRLASNPHPNIREVFIQNDEITEKHINGIPLSECGYFNMIDSYSISLQIVNAVKHIHKLGIIHRDIKPKNIIIEHDTNKCYLIDFDVSVMYSKVEKKINATGTIEYMSPEQILGDNPEFSDDIYSLCKTLLEKLNNHSSLVYIFEKGIVHNKELRYKNILELEQALLSIDLTNFKHEENHTNSNSIEDISHESKTNSKKINLVNEQVKKILFYTILILGILIIIFFMFENGSTSSTNTTESYEQPTVSEDNNINDTSSSDNGEPLSASEKHERSDFIIDEDNISQVSSINVENLYNLSEDNLLNLGFVKDDNSFIYKEPSDYHNQEYISITIDYDDEVVKFNHGAYTETVSNYNSVTCRTIQDGEYNCNEEFMYYYPLERLYIDFYNESIYNYIDFTDENGDEL